MPRIRRFAAPRAAAGAAALALLAAPAICPAPAHAAGAAFPLDGGKPPLGLATDHGRDRYWVLTASSGRLVLHSYAADGTHEGQMNSRDNLTNAQALAYVDGEAYVGDIGGPRAAVVVYRVTEPWPGTEINHAVSYGLAYPDGKHDAAALLVDEDHRFYVVTTGDGAGVYRAQVDPPAGAESALERVADAPDGVTDGVVLVDGRFVLRTASQVFVLDPEDWSTLATADLGIEETGRAVTQTADEASLLTGMDAEHRLSTSAIPGPAPAEPTAKPTRMATDTNTSNTPSDTRTFAQTGTTTALGAALGVAALAAIVVLLKR